MDALEARHVHETSRVPDDQHPVPVQALRNRVEASLGNRASAPLHALSTAQDLTHEGMPLEPLQELVHIEAALPVVQADDQSERYKVRPHRVHPAATERVPRKRPAQRMDDPIEGLLHLPQLLDAQSEDLGVRRTHSLGLEPRLAERATCPLGQNRHPSTEIHGRHEAAPRPPLPVQASGHRPRSDDPALLDEQSVRREPGEYVDS